MERLFWWWIRYGIKRGWFSEPSCSTHEGTPRTAEEEARWEAGEDPCEVVIRVWYDG